MPEIKKNKQRFKQRSDISFSDVECCWLLVVVVVDDDGDVDSVYCVVCD